MLIYGKRQHSPSSEFVVLSFRQLAQRCRLQGVVAWTRLDLSETEFSILHPLGKQLRV